MIVVKADEPVPAPGTALKVTVKVAGSSLTAVVPPPKDTSPSAPLGTKVPLKPVALVATATAAK